jgi:hypothetical protein
MSFAYFRNKGEIVWTCGCISLGAVGYGFIFGRGLPIPLTFYLGHVVLGVALTFALAWPLRMLPIRFKVFVPFFAFYVGLFADEKFARTRDWARAHQDEIQAVGFAVTVAAASMVVILILRVLPGRYRDSAAGDDLCQEPPELPKSSASADESSPKK